MPRLLRPAAIWAVAAAVVATAGACHAQLAPNVAAVVDRTKSTRATYAIYTWIRISRPGQPPHEEWSAEFNSGALHRVETPRDRVVANCEAKTGSALSLVTGKIRTGPDVADAACGITTNFQVDAVDWLGRRPSALGPLDVIRLTGGPFIRTYWVNPDGVIVRSTYQANSPDRADVLQTLSTTLSPMLPPGDLFSETSSSRSIVPDGYKSGPSGQRWPEGR